MFATALLVLALANAARAQESTVSLFPEGFQEDGLRGQAVGTGPDGTTFLLLGTFDTFSIPFTMTLVEDATHISEVAVIETAGISLLIENQCGFSSDQVTCTELLIDTSTSALTVSGVVEFTGVPVFSGSAASALNSTSSSTPQVTITGTTGASSSNSISTLPASISVSPKSSATVSPTGSATTPTVLPASTIFPSGTSGASRNSFVALGLALSVLLVGLTSL